MYGYIQYIYIYLKQKYNIQYLQPVKRSLYVIFRSDIV